MNQKDRNGRTPLVTAILTSGSIEVIKRLLQEESVDVNSRDKDGTTSLHCAARRGHNQIVLLLLKNPRVEVNCRTNNESRLPEHQRGATPLHVAAQCHQTEVVKLLLNDPRTEVNSKNKKNNTPLMEYVKTPLPVLSGPPTLRLFLNHPSVDLYTRDDEGKGLKEVAR